MPDLLLELGCEELPAFEVRRAADQLLAGVLSRLDESGLAHGAGSTMATPRRLIVHVADVAARQPDSVKEQRGPSASAAFDSSGAPSGALLGFCKGQGVDPSSVVSRDDYVWVTKNVVGLAAREVLAEVLPLSIRALTFDKTMRWGSGKMRFARPIRWILASFDDAIVPFDIEGVSSGLLSRGHRFLAPASFEAKNFGSLVQGLRKRWVEPDAGAREKRIREGAGKVAIGKPILSDQLVEENVYLTEWPEAMLGDFPDLYLSLPEPVLVAAMAKHEKFFPVRNEAGALTNKFVSIRNGGEPSAVLRGNQWVLNARFNDAKFFFDDDTKRSMDDFLARTERMSFAEGLGSIRQRADRLSQLAHEVALSAGSPEATADLAKKAGLYAKADLSSGLVSEMASLQGIVGAEYAAREKFEESVCEAIRFQYDPHKALHGKHNAVSLAIIVADQLDKLAGYLGLGRVPSGSSDPFGLRRAATVLVDCSRSGYQPSGGFSDLLKGAVGLYQKQGIALDGGLAEASLADLFAGRYESMNPDAEHDVLQAALLDRSAGATLDPVSFGVRLKVASGASLDHGFVQAATRPINIVAAARKKGINIPVVADIDSLDASALDSEEGSNLLKAAREAAIATKGATDPAAIFVALKRLEKPINAFFEGSMVMVEDEKVRDARLSMLSAVATVLEAAGDMSKIVIDG